jgi:hypothetical protein
MGASEDFTVVTVTVTAADAPAVNWTGFVTVQAVVAGAPEHAMVKAPEYPAPGVSCKMYRAVWPAVTAVVSAEDGLVTVNAGLAVPFTVKACGEFGASSVIVTVSIRVPTPTGAKVTEIVQLVLGAIGALTQGFDGLTNSDRFAPPKTTPEMCSGAVPVFEITTLAELPDVP